MKRTINWQFIRPTGQWGAGFVLTVGTFIIGFGYWQLEVNW